MFLLLGHAGKFIHCVHLPSRCIGQIRLNGHMYILDVGVGCPFRFLPPPPLHLFSNSPPSHFPATPFTPPLVSIQHYHHHPQTMTIVQFYATSCFSAFELRGNEINNALGGDWTKFCSALGKTLNILGRLNSNSCN